MAVSRDLKPSFLELSIDGQTNLIKNLRALRRELFPKKVPKTRAKKSNPSKALNIIEGLQGSELDQLIKRMEQRKAKK